MTRKKLFLLKKYIFLIFLTNKKQTYRSELKSKISKNIADFTNQNEREILRRKDLIKSQQNEQKREDENLLKQKKDIELEKTKELQRSRVELEKSVFFVNLRY